MVFVPFHWGDVYGERTAANYLTISATGRVAKQPELKFCAVPAARPVRAGPPIGRRREPLDHRESDRSNPSS